MSASNGSDSQRYSMTDFDAAMNTWILIDKPMLPLSHRRLKFVNAFCMRENIIHPIYHHQLRRTDSSDYIKLLHPNLSSQEQKLAKGQPSLV